MKFHLIKTYLDLQKLIESEINLDESKNLKPTQLPCIAVIAYAGAGWDEINFVYRHNLCPSGCVLTGVDHSNKYHSKRSDMNITEKTAAPTPPEELEKQIMSECISKNEREWWAKRRIEDLEQEVGKLKMMIDNGLGWEDLQEDISYPDSIE